MKIILVIIFSIFYDCPLITTQDKNAKEIVCVIAGQFWDDSFVINEKELPERCDLFTVGLFAFDRKDGTYVMENDEKAMACLKKANQTVYLNIGFIDDDDWGSVFNPKDVNECNTKKFDPLVDFLIKYNIDGLFIRYNLLLYNEIQNLSQKISDFITSINNKVVGLKVGILFIVSDQITNTTLFDFTLTNEKIDYYVIDLTNLNDCDENSKKYGLSPISNETMLSIEEITCVVTNSTLDQSKLFAKLEVSVLIPNDLIKKGEKCVKSYSTYCEDPVKSCRWCANPSKLSYDQGAYVAKFYKGMYLEVLDTDDFQCSCGCGKFPVTNLIIDGWKNSEFKTCPKLD